MDGRQSHGCLPYVSILGARLIPDGEQRLRSEMEQEVEAARFRRDLYYRLSVFPLKVPPLRERLEDIPLLAASFLAQTAKRIHCRVQALTQSNVDDLTRYAWPGNIRELQNVIERAVILAGGGALSFSLRDSTDTVAGFKPTTPVSTRAQRARRCWSWHVAQSFA
jgi:transcriptional regulator with GAF, ATPase, and Fis domain